MRPGAEASVIYVKGMHHSVGDLAEVLDNLGVFRTAPQDLVELCSSGFRRVPISTGSDYYLSLQGFAPRQIAYAHTHPDSRSGSPSWAATAKRASAPRFRCR